MRWKAILVVVVWMIIFLVGCTQKEVPAENQPAKTPSKTVGTATPEITTPEMEKTPEQEDLESLVSAVDSWIKPVLETASGGTVELIDYQANRVTKLSGLTLHYSLPEKVVDKNTMMVDPNLHLKMSEIFENKPEVKIVQVYDLPEDFIYLVEIAGPLKIGDVSIAYMRVSITAYQPTILVDVLFPAQVEFGEEAVSKAKELVEEKWLNKVSSGYGKNLKLIDFTGSGYLVDGGLGKGYSAWLVYDVGHEKGAEILCGKAGGRGWWTTSVMGGCMNVEEFTMEYGGQKIEVKVRSVSLYNHPERVVVGIHSETSSGMAGMSYSLPGGD